MANVVPLFDPDRPLSGQARARALVSYRAAVAVIAEKAFGEYFSAACQLREGGDLRIDVAVPAIVAALHKITTERLRY